MYVFWAYMLSFINYSFTQSSCLLFLSYSQAIIIYYTYKILVRQPTVI